MNGTEWIVDAQECSADTLRSVEALRELFDRMIATLDLRTVGQTLWHQFPGAGGITGLCLLAESHLTCHTFPEMGLLCLNLFCCTPRARWEFESEITRMFSATSVRVREVARVYSAASDVHSACATVEAQ